MCTCRERSLSLSIYIYTNAYMYVYVYVYVYNSIYMVYIYVHICAYIYIDQCGRTAIPTISLFWVEKSKRNIETKKKIRKATGTINRLERKIGTENELNWCVFGIISLFIYRSCAFDFSFWEISGYSVAPHDKSKNAEIVIFSDV